MAPVLGEWEGSGPPGEQVSSAAHAARGQRSEQLHKVVVSLSWRESAPVGKGRGPWPGPGGHEGGQAGAGSLAAPSHLPQPRQRPLDGLGHEQGECQC